uniref:Motilin n=1 Tax=Zonotrichia albicollis TaxID=44394 RepID=A0A8D2QFB8_ZONAL
MERSQCCQLPWLLTGFPHHTWLLFTADLHTVPRNLTSPPALLDFSPQRSLRPQLMGTSTTSLVLCPALWIPGCWDSTEWVCCCSQHHQLPPLLSAPKLQEKERNKAGQKKSLSSLQQLEEEGFSEQSGVDVNAAKTLQQALPVRAWLTPRQLEKYQDVLEKLLAELLQDTPDAD